MNVLVSVALAGVILLMVNYLSYRHHVRWDISSSDYYRLSGKTISLLSNLDAEVNVLVFLQKNHELYSDIRNVLREYEYAAARQRKLKLSMEAVEPLLAPVTRGQRVGVVRVTLDGKPVGEYPLQALADVQLASLFGRAWDTVRLWVK